MSLGHDYMSYFDVSPTNFPWRSPRPQEIEMRRAHMTDVLIFDILLSSGGIGHPDALYPPATPEALQDLLDAIANSTYDALKRDCLVYFLLKWHQDGREEEFKIRRCIPPQFSGLADAYWHLDSGIHIAVRPACFIHFGNYTHGNSEPCQSSATHESHGTIHQRCLRPWLLLKNPILSSVHTSAPPNPS